MGCEANKLGGLTCTFFLWICQQSVVDYWQLQEPKTERRIYYGSQPLLWIRYQTLTLRLGFTFLSSFLASDAFHVGKLRSAELAKKKKKKKSSQAIKFSNTDAEPIYHVMSVKYTVKKHCKAALSELAGILGMKEQKCYAKKWE